MWVDKLKYGVLTKRGRLRSLVALKHAAIVIFYLAAFISAAEMTDFRANVFKIAKMFINMEGALDYLFH